MQVGQKFQKGWAQISNMGNLAIFGVTTPRAEKGANVAGPPQMGRKRECKAALVGKTCQATCRELATPLHMNFGALLLRDRGERNKLQRA